MIALLLPSLAFAEPPTEVPSPARMCADAASGSEIEVCLRLAAQHPEAVDTIGAALRSHLDRASSPDRELLLGLLAWLSDETAVAAAARLAQVGDPRALPPLIEAVGTREETVALAALEALPAWPESIQPLSAWLVERDLDLPLRLAAADALGALGTDEARDALADLLRRPGVPAELRERATRTLEARWPDRRRREDRQPSLDGTPWVAAGSAWALGAAMATAGHLGQFELAPLGAATGAAAGGTAGYLFGRAWPMEAGDAAFVTTSVVLGGAGAALLGAGLAPGDEDLRWWMGLGGTATGYGAGYALRAAHPGSAQDAVEAAALSGALGGGAAALMDAAGRPEHADLALGVGLLGGLAAGHAAAPHLDLTARDAPMLGLTTAVGAGTVWLVAPEQPTAIAAGAAGGLVVGYVTAGAVDIPDDILLAGAVGAGFGGAIGGGAGQLVGVGRSAAVAGGVAGLATGTTLAAVTREPVDDRDVILVLASTAFAAWQTAGWTSRSGATLSDPAGGLVWMVPAAVGAGTAALAIEVDVPAPHAATASSLALWGGWFGGVSGELAADEALLGALVGSDAGLVVGALALGPTAGLPPLVVGLADAGGVLGGSMAALGAAAVVDEPDTLALTALVGSGVGLGAGAVVGTVWRRNGTTRDVALRLPDLGGARVGFSPLAVADGQGLAVNVTGW